VEMLATLANIFLAITFTFFSVSKATNGLHFREDPVGPKVQGKGITYFGPRPNTNPVISRVIDKQKLLPSSNPGRREGKE